MNFTCNCHENDVEGNYHILYRLRHNLNDQKSFRPHFCHLYFKTQIWERVCFSILLSCVLSELGFCPSLGISIDVWDLIRSQRNEKCLGWGVNFVQIFHLVFTSSYFCTLSIQQADVAVFVRLQISTSSPFKNRNRQTQEKSF